jgi:Zn-dependent protease
MAPGDTIALGLMWYFVFMFSTTCHEAAHAFVAKKGGDLTAFQGGQLTLNPLPHLKREPIGMILIPIASYFAGGWMMGWASAPYDPDWSRKYPHRAAKMAFAGPVANFILAGIAALLIHGGLLFGFFAPPDSAGFTHIVEPASPGLAEAVAQLLGLLFAQNVLLGCFNLLPIPPLDGFSVMGLFVSEDRARGLQEMGFSMQRFTFMGMLLSWRLFDGLYDPMFSVMLKLLYPMEHYGS